MFLTDFNRPSDTQEAYTRTDLGVRYESPATDWVIEALVQNIEDETVKNNVDLRGNQPGTGGVPDFPAWRVPSSMRHARTDCARRIASATENIVGYAPWIGAEKRGVGSHQDDVPTLCPLEGALATRFSA
jgi:hypothetical protein